MTDLDLLVNRAPRGDCACGQRDTLLFRELEKDDWRCAACYRVWTRQFRRVQDCDKCGAPTAWRNPYTRRNEYLCSRCHAESGEGVVQNRWAGAGSVTVRQSLPLGVRGIEQCEARNVPGTKDCRGEVKPRAGGAVLCNAHAGRPR